MAAGGELGAETSIDKVLVATAEQAVFDLVEEALADQIVLGDDAAASAVEVAPTPPGTWSAAVATAQLAVGHELIGASRAMLGLAREHALERVQFGRPIAAFAGQPRLRFSTTSRWRLVQ